MTLFEKIAAGEIPARVIHQNDDFVVIHDVKPQAPVHALMFPRKVIPRIAEARSEDAELLGKMMSAIPAIARQLGIAERGFRIVINNGPNAGETVPHLHIHLLGGRALEWPPG